MALTRSGQGRGGGGDLLRLIVECLIESFRDTVVGSPQPLRMSMLKTAQTSNFRSLRVGWKSRNDGIRNSEFETRNSEYSEYPE